MKTIYKLLSILVLLFSSNLSMAQNDYVIEYSNQDTCISTSISNYDKLLRHIIPEKKEINHLYKIDLIQLARLNLNFSFEHRLTHKFTLEHEASFHIMANSPYSSYSDYLKGKTVTFFYKFSNESIYYLNLNSKLKYYHNIDSRTKRGKNTNGFSGNYFLTGFEINMAFYDTDIWHIQDNGSLSTHPWSSSGPKISPYFIFGNESYHESIGHINFGYGLQRRIGNVGFWSAEAKVGVGTNKYFDTIYIPFEINLKAGFALPSLSRKR